MPNRVVTTFENKVAGRGLEDYIANLDEAESKTKAVARAMAAMADDVVQESKRSEQAVSKLSAALGPEFVRNSARGEQGIRDVITQLRQMGAEFDDIDANVDELAASLRKVEAAGDSLDKPKRAASDTADEVDRLSDSGRGANSALANMVGNSAQDVGELGGVAGSAGVALGQMAEYASDAALGGEALGSALKSMALVAGPIAAITLGVQLLNYALNQGKERAEAIAKATEEYTDALIAAQDAGDDLATTLDDQVRSNVTDWLTGLGDKTDEVVTALDALGLSQGDLVRAFRDGDGPLVEAIARHDDLADAIRLTKAQMGEDAALRQYARQHHLNSEAVIRQYRETGTLIRALDGENDVSVQAIANAQMLTDWRQRGRVATEDSTRATNEQNFAIENLANSERIAAQTADEMAAADQRATAAAMLRKQSIDAVRQAEERRLSTFLRTVGGDIGIRAAQSDAIAAFNDPNMSFDQKLQSILGAATQVAAIRQTELESRGNRVDANVQAQLLKEALDSFARTFGQIFLGDNATLELGDAIAAALRGYIGDISAGQAGRTTIPFRGSYATGTSRVPGPDGMPGWAIVHGGEQITSVGGGSSTSSTTVSIPVTVHAGLGTDGHQVGRQIVEAIDSAVRGGQQFSPFTLRAIRG